MQCVLQKLTVNHIYGILLYFFTVSNCKITAKSNSAWTLPSVNVRDVISQSEASVIANQHMLLWIIKRSVLSANKNLNN